MVDFDALIAGGIPDARERAPLIEYLDGLGFTAEQLIDAERRGRLFGLAGVAVSAPAALTLKGFAEPVTAYALIPD